MIDQQELLKIVDAMASQLKDQAQAQKEIDKQQLINLLTRLRMKPDIIDQINKQGIPQTIFIPKRLGTKAIRSLFQSMAIRCIINELVPDNSFVFMWSENQMVGGFM